MTTFPTDRPGEMRPRLSGEYDALAEEAEEEPAEGKP